MYEVVLKSAVIDECMNLSERIKKENELKTLYTALKDYFSQIDAGLIRQEISPSEDIISKPAIVKDSYLLLGNTAFVCVSSKGFPSDEKYAPEQDCIEIQIASRIEDTAEDVADDLVSEVSGFNIVSSKK